MTFTVTYRGKDGALRDEVVEAASRAECVAECKRRGISPTAIREGRSAKSAPKSVPHRGSGTSATSSTKHGHYLAVAALCAAVLGGGLWWWFGREAVQPAPVEKPTKPKVVKSLPQPRPQVVTPAPPPETNAVRKVVPKGTPMSERTPPKTYRDERGILRYEGGARAPDPTRPIHAAKRIVDPINDSVFKTRPENEIATLLTAMPGETILALRRYDETFESEFMKSLENNLEVTEDDTPARAELKRAMVEMKKELAERIKAGEKLGDILEEARSELRRLADYRRNLEKMVSEAARNPESAEQDVADCLAAANKMLTDNGLKPIKSGIVRKNLIMRAKNQTKETSK